MLPGLDTFARCPYRRGMAQSILIFDFGTNEEAAQQARHKVEAWKQGFRLGSKMLLKFDRKESSGKDGGQNSSEKKPAGKKSAGKTDGEKAEGAGSVRVLLRLDFSEHEKLSHQRWLDRIPNEEPFKSAEAETIRSGDAAHSKTAELFDSLD
jgi:hypothetical protein